MDTVLECGLRLCRTAVPARPALPVDCFRLFGSIYRSSAAGTGMELFPNLSECTQHYTAVTVMGSGHPEQLLDAIRGSVKLPRQSNVSDDKNE